MRYFFYFLVVFHMLVVLGNFLSFFVTPMLAPWYEALPICSFILLISFSRELKCPLTRLENYLRKKLGMKKIGGFIGHYLIRPTRKKLRERQTKRIEKIEEIPEKVDEDWWVPETLSQIM